MLSDYVRDNPGQKIDNRAWNYWSTELAKIIGRPIPNSKLTDKRDRLKSTYASFKQLQQVTSLGWNKELKMFTGPSEF